MQSIFPEITQHTLPKEFVRCCDFCANGSCDVRRCHGCQKLACADHASVCALCQQMWSCTECSVPGRPPFPSGWRYCSNCLSPPTEESPPATDPILALQETPEYAAYCERYKVDYQRALDAGRRCHDCNVGVGVNVCHGCTDGVIVTDETDRYCQRCLFVAECCPQINECFCRDCIADLVDSCEICGAATCFDCSLACDQCSRSNVCFAHLARCNKCDEYSCFLCEPDMNHPDRPSSDTCSRCTPDPYPLLTFDEQDEQIPLIPTLQKSKM